MGAWGTALYSDDFALDVKIDLLSAIKGNIKIIKLLSSNLLFFVEYISYSTKIHNNKGTNN